jgi:hypothetical protein
MHSCVQDPEQKPEYEVYKISAWVTDVLGIKNKESNWVQPSEEEPPYQGRLTEPPNR